MLKNKYFITLKVYKGVIKRFLFLTHKNKKSKTCFNIILYL